MENLKCALTNDHTGFVCVLGHFIPAVLTEPDRSVCALFISYCLDSMRIIAILFVILGASPCPVAGSETTGMKMEAVQKIQQRRCIGRGSGGLVSGAGHGAELPSWLHEELEKHNTASRALLIPDQCPGRNVP